MSKIHRFDTFKVNESTTNESAAHVAEYVAKFKMKMSGSTKGTAAGWIDGIGGISDKDKKEIWKKIQDSIDKDADDKTELPKWVNEADEVNELTDSELKDEEVREMTNIIYDTLMKNTQHPQFDVKKVDDQDVDGNQIYFIYEGVSYVMTLEKDPRQVEEKKDQLEK